MQLENKIQIKEFDNSKKNNFKESIKEYFRKCDPHNYATLFGLLIFSVTIGFTVYKFIDILSESNSAWKIFFGMFDRFTYQSNWLLLIYVLFYIIKPNHQFFNGNKLVISIMVYIFFTFIGCNVVLVGISKDRGYSGSSIGVASNVWLHIIAPLYFIFMGLITMYFKPNQQPKCLIKTILTGMIYPTIYAIYLITIPWTFVDYRNNPSFYGVENAKYVHQAYSVYGNATNTYNYPLSWAYILVMYFLFFPGTFAIFYYSWKWFNTLNNKKNKS